MAATYNVWTITKELQKRFNDPNASWLTSAQLGHMIGRGALGIGEQTIYFYQESTNTAAMKYTTRGQWGSYAIWFRDETTPFTGTSGVTYEVDCMGTIQVTAGTDALTSPLSVLGTLVDIGALTFEVALLKAAQESTKPDSVNIGATGYSTVTQEDRLIRIGERYKGIR